jgi:UDP-N-acetylmuramyl pentapeptide phosphotransferase/UDP-N-acetylglucosamine-1-phosphate transferase
LISFFLGVVAFQTAQPFLGWIAVAMLGGCLGFLPFNLRSKKSAAIFLGDAGSIVIGFILACLAVYGDWSESSPVVALVSPVLIFWILIFDMVHITVDRILTGKVTNFKQWIEYVGKDHLHHRLAREKAKRALYLSAESVPWHQCGCVAQCPADGCRFIDYPGKHNGRADYGIGAARTARKWIAEIKALKVRKSINIS